MSKFQGELKTHPVVALGQGNQEQFNIVVRGLRSQGFEQSFDMGPEGHSQCLLRGPEGRKCAAGWLIADEDYDPSLEINFGIRMLNIDSSWVYDLQYCHDENRSPKRMESALRAFAVKHNLTFPED